MQIHPLKLISRRQALAYIGVAGPSIALSGVALAGPAEVAARINDITRGASGDRKGTARGLASDFRPEAGGQFRTIAGHAA